MQLSFQVAALAFLALQFGLVTAAPMTDKMIRIRSEGGDTYVPANIFTMLNSDVEIEVEARGFVAKRDISGQEDLALYASKHKRSGLDGFFLGSPRTAALEGIEQGSEFPITASLLGEYDNTMKVEAALPGQIEQVLATAEKREPSTIKYEYARGDVEKREPSTIKYEYARDEVDRREPSTIKYEYAREEVNKRKPSTIKYEYARDEVAKREPSTIKYEYA
ncbi:hypothetical protein F5Y10DRAFT_266647 [Nemania abortiva]|nr:hypothetical protein F5Y10DRAFT_266647 [Nemania abortiva]